MAISQDLDAPWTRKHDDARQPLIPDARCVVYPQTLADLVEICQSQPGDQRLKAAGSHWGLSAAAISDDTFIETHDPRNIRPAMGRTLTNVVPKCLNRDYVQRMVELGVDYKWMLVHIEAGKRIYQLYAELDQPMDVGDSGNLAGYISHEFGDPGFGGPWAFATLGGAGGQTVVGAFSTGTHGGDFDRPPLADSVVAIHLVADGGKHYWIEAVDPELPQLTDDSMMSLEFRGDELGGADNFEIIRDNEIFNAVLVSVGRFGVIYSVVLKAVPQYSLLEKRRLHLWQDIKKQIGDRSGPLYDDRPPPGAQSGQRFLQIAVSLTTHAFFQRNLVGVTKRWNGPISAIESGRDERVGSLEDGFDPLLQAPRFANAGITHAYSPDPDNPQRGAEPGMLERACADASFLRGVLTQTIDEIEKLVASNGAEVGVGIAAITAVGGGGLLLLLPALFALLFVLRAILGAINDDTRFGEVMNQVKDNLLDSNADPEARAAGLFAWQLIYYLAFQDQQSDRDYEAVSYAVMDQHDYLNVSCDVNVDSIEVFFDAVDERLIAFVDALIAFEIEQEFQGKAFLGYASLRFTQSTRALIGMQRYDTSCAIEIACLKDVTGGEELIEFAAAFATNPNIGGILHWGQHNQWTRTEVERTYRDNPAPPGDTLSPWRAALQRIAGDSAAFSSEFTATAGLEQS